MVRRLLLVWLAAFLFAATGASAADYPNRTVRLIVPYPAGGFADAICRLIGQRLQQRLGQPFIVESKPGAGANIGTEAVAKSPPDGYTLLFVSTANAINTSLYKKLAFNFKQDITLVAAFVRMPQLIVVNPAVPVKTVREFIDYAKAHPGEINMASAGVGTGNHLAGEIFQAMTGVKFTHVPYRGTAPAMTDLIGGQVQVIFDNIATSYEHIQAGKIRAIAATTSTRLPLLPDVPTVAETVPGYEAVSFYGLGAPKGTPPEVVALLNKEVNLALEDPVIQKTLLGLGTLITPGSPQDFERLMESETERWASAVKASGASID